MRGERPRFDCKIFGPQLFAQRIGQVRQREGHEAAFVRLVGAGPDALDGLPGVLAVSGAPADAELTLADDADPDAILRALVSRGSVRRFEVRAPSLHEIFKRVVGEAVVEAAAKGDDMPGGRSERTA